MILSSNRPFNNEADNTFPVPLPPELFYAVTKEEQQAVG